MRDTRSCTKTTSPAPAARAVQIQRERTHERQQERRRDVVTDEEGHPPARTSDRSVLMNTHGRPAAVVVSCRRGENNASHSELRAA